MRSPLLRPCHDRSLDARIAIEPQKAVRTKVHDFVPVHTNAAIRPDLIDDEVLQMVVGKKCLVVLDEANQPVLAQHLGQLLHRGMGHAFSSRTSENPIADLRLQI